MCCEGRRLGRLETVRFWAHIRRAGRPDAGIGTALSFETVIGGRDFELATAARRWRQELLVAGTPSLLFTESLGALILVHLLRNYVEGKARSSGPGGLGTRRLTQVIDHIEAHLGDDISLGKLAAVAGLSPCHFAAAFKASTGVAPYRFVLERRIERSKCLLLEHGSIPIVEIAESLGFSSHAHFTGHFRRLSGTTPSHFRAEGGKARPLMLNHEPDPVDGSMIFTPDGARLAAICRGKSPRQPDGPAALRPCHGG